MKPNLTSALIVLAIILFFVGRFTAPATAVEDTRKIDSLKRDIFSRTKREQILMDSVNHYRIMSDTWYQQAMSAPKAKVVTRDRYDNTAKIIDRSSVPELDSMFVARYGRAE